MEISREALAALPIHRYEGEVAVLRTEAELHAAMPELLAEAVIGFDTETRPAFRPGERYLPSLFQAATGRRVYLFPLQRLHCAEALRPLLAEARIVKAGVSVADDLKKLKELFPFEEKNVVDLGTVAKRNGVKQSGVRNLAGLFLGFRIPKGASTSNWAAHELRPQQVAYAAMDAWACRALYLKFRELGFV